MKVKYDSERQRAIFLEIPLIREDYLALRESFGDSLIDIILADKLENFLERGAIKFKNKRVYGIEFKGKELDINELGYLFQRLKGLEEVTLEDCKLTSLPDTTYLLPNLKKLCAENNFISEISSDIKNLKKLKSLDLNLNLGLADLPKEILRLNNLREIYLYNTGMNKNMEIVKKLRKKGIPVMI